MFLSENFFRALCEKISLFFFTLRDTKIYFLKCCDKIFFSKLTLFCMAAIFLQNIFFPPILQTVYFFSSAFLTKYFFTKNQIQNIFLDKNQAPRGLQVKWLVPNCPEHMTWTELNLNHCVT